MKTTWLACLAAFALLALSGCDEKQDDPDRDDPRPPKPQAKPALPSNWEGRWESAGHPGHGGGLSCVTKETAAEEWSATFSAEFGRVKDYAVVLKGKRDGEKVVFGGAVDIGKEKGEGLFKWKGAANATEFRGDYEGGGDKGTFLMKPKGTGKIEGK